MKFLSHLVVIALGFAATSASAGDKLVVSRIAFGSCARQDKPQPIWDAVVATKPDIYLSLGDNIYGDTEDMAVMKKKYDQLAAIPGWQKLPRRHFEGKAIRVVGTLSLFAGRPQIIVSEADKINVVK